MIKKLFENPASKLISFILLILAIGYVTNTIDTIFKWSQWLIGWPLIVDAFQNPIIGTIKAFAYLFFYFWLVFPFYSKIDEYPTYLQLPIGIASLGFVVFDFLVNNTICWVIFAQHDYLKEKRDYGGKIQASDYLVTARVGWYKLAYDKGERYFHDPRDYGAKLIIWLAEIVDNRHFRTTHNEFLGIV